MAAKGWITIHVHTYSKQSHNHTMVDDTYITQLKLKKIKRT